MPILDPTVTGADDLPRGRCSHQHQRIAVMGADVVMDAERVVLAAHQVVREAEDLEWHHAALLVH